MIGPLEHGLFADHRKAQKLIMQQLRLSTYLAPRVAATFWASHRRKGGARDI
jgi:hypothetical protein